MTREPVQIRYIQYGSIPSAPPKSEVPTEPKLSTYRPDRNLRVACEVAGISVADARSRNTTRTMSFKRFQVMAIMRSWNRSTPHIGRLLNRDHSTVVKALRRWEDLNATIEANGAEAIRA